MKRLRSTKPSVHPGNSNCRRRTSSRFEKANFARYTISKSPVQTKAKAVIRKYRLHIRQMEFRRLQQLVPSVQHSEPSEVSINIIFYPITFRLRDK